MLRRIGLLLLPLAICSAPSLYGSDSHDLDKAAAQALAAARESRDSTGSKVASSVISSMLKGEHIYSDDTRKAAVDLISELDLKEYAPALREVAQLGPEPGQTGLGDRNRLAIFDALHTLSRWRDPSAIELNRRRLDGDPWLKMVAVSDLALLKDWASTDRIVEVLSSSTLPEDDLSLVTEALAFLSMSPATGSSTCVELRRVDSAYASCLRPLDDWKCGKLSEHLDALMSRLHCTTTRAGGEEGADESKPD